jgi:hypothetical protein
MKDVFREPKPQEKPAMSQSSRRIACCLALTVVLGLGIPSSAMAAGHGTGHSTARHVARVNHARARIEAHRRTSEIRRHHTGSGVLSANAYWKAVNSPNPPQLHGNNSLYQQKLQAWQQYHQR